MVVNGVDATPFIFGRYSINTTAFNTFASASLRAGSTYAIDFQVGFLDLLSSNFNITTAYTGLFEDSGFIGLKCSDTRGKTDLVNMQITSPDESTSVIAAANSFLGVAGPNFGLWHITGTVTPSSDGVLTVKGGQSAASVDPLFYAAPSMSVTLLSD
tara:strand:+ start:44 stop:514 length:471 start_codon:yes stop_codon:yes gene_type:complete